MYYISSALLYTRLLHGPKPRYFLHDPRLFTERYVSRLIINTRAVREKR